MLANDSDKDNEAKNETNLITPKEETKLERAKIAGQVHALSQHPATMPAFSEDWAFEYSKKGITQLPEIEYSNQAELETLAIEFMKGYREFFNEYYDIKPAWDFGYQYGLKFDPNLFGYDLNYNIEKLNEHRERIESEFLIKNEAEWQSFYNAFNKGFVKGYHQTKEGVTNKSINTKSIIEMRQLYLD